jgi:long-chain acyl-CoA synthetase
MNIAEVLRRAALRQPTRPAVRLGERVMLDYAALAQRCARMAGGLQRLGCLPGDRVVLWMGNSPTYLEALWACWWAGLTVVPINAKLHAREAAWITSDAQARLCWVADAAQGQAARELAHWPAALGWLDSGTASAAALCDGPPLPLQPCSDDTLAWLFYTSGTTGRPKGVMLGHRQLRAMALSYHVDVDAVHPDHAVVYAAPMSHGAGLYTVPYMMGCAQHVIPASGGFDAGELFGLARTVGRLAFFAAPTMVRRLVEFAQAHALDGRGFRCIVYGGAPMYAADIERALQVMGPCFTQIYGQGESPMTITVLDRRHLADLAHPRHAERRASVGVAHTVVEVRVADAEGRPLPSGETGEVLVRGDTVMTGYWHQPQAGAQALQDGWLHTGDVGSLDDDGFLTLKDRSKDVIISGGSNIYPREVEEGLLLDPAVAEVSVIGEPDPQWGENVVACVVVRSGQTLDLQRLDALCLDHIARFKRPKRYVVLAELPKSHYGKVLKSELRRYLRG